MPTGLYTRWNYDTESQKLLPRQNKTRSSENIVFSYFQHFVRNVRLKAMLQPVEKRRLIASMLMEFVTIGTLSLKQWAVVTTTVHVKKLARHGLTTNL